MGRPKGSKNGQTTLANNVCVKCGTKETPQWYAGSTCKSCYRKFHRKENIEQFKFKDAAHYQTNKDKVLLRQKKYYEENKERIKAVVQKYRDAHELPSRNDYRKLWLIENPTKNADYMRTYTLRHPERAKAHSKKYISANLPKFAAREAMKRAKKQKATPVWMSEHHKYLIEQFYLNRPAGCDVDHIVPLNGADVCGLHVIWNLQYLDSRENRRKSNKLFK